MTFLFTDIDGAEALIEEALDTFVAAGDLWGIAFTSGQLAGLGLQRRHYGPARKAMLQSLEAGEALGAQGWNGVAMQGLAVLDIREGNPERGVRLAGAADRMIELAGGEVPPAVSGLEDPLEIVKGNLPQGQIDALWEEGRRMDPDEAIALARRKARHDDLGWTSNAGDGGSPDL